VRGVWTLLQAAGIELLWPDEKRTRAAVLEKRHECT
jgi:hypothetical protein